MICNFGDYESDCIITFDTNVFFMSFNNDQLSSNKHNHYSTINFAGSNNFTGQAILPPILSNLYSDEVIPGHAQLNNPNVWINGTSYDKAKNTLFSEFGWYTREQSGIVDPVNYWPMANVNFMNCPLFSCDITIPDGILEIDNMFRGCQSFTGKVKIPESVIVTRSAFAECTAFNSPVYLSDRVRDCTNMFCNCNALSSEIVIGANAGVLINMFSGCVSFNEPVTIPDNIYPYKYLSEYKTAPILTGMFSNCLKFNQPLVLPNTCANNSLDCVFDNCWEYNQPIKIPDSMNNHSLYATFRNCRSLNSPITFHEDWTPYSSLHSLFADCWVFRQPFTFPNNVTPNLDSGTFSIASMFYNCLEFDYPLNIPHQVTNFQRAFENCVELNSDLSIPYNDRLNYPVNYSHILCGCETFNLPINIPVQVTDLSGAFSRCRMFNQPINFDDDFMYEINAASAFSNCLSFNQSVHLSDKFRNCGSMFYGCSDFDSEVVIPGTITNCYSMFGGCTNLNTYPTFPNSFSQNISCGRMFTGCTNLNPASIEISDRSITACDGMFKGCSKLNCPVTISIPILNLSGMFSGCSNLDSNVTVRYDSRNWNINSMTTEYLRDILSSCKKFSKTLTITGSPSININQATNLFLWTGLVPSNNKCNAKISVGGSTYAWSNNKAVIV